MSLEDLRRRINEVDARIVEALAERVRIVKLIREIKEKEKKPLLDSAREKEVIEKVRRRAEMLSLDPELAETIFRVIILASIREQVI
ncbi:MAG TPA: chorismate mutase [Candidatus Korarchaeota archaeon]|nr:chorismate mutase [Candidatus Korarchaeota archaeon]